MLARVQHDNDLLDPTVLAFAKAEATGIGMIGIQKRILDLHARAWSEDFTALPIGGFYKYRRGAETHAWAPDLIHLLQFTQGERFRQKMKRDRGVP